MDELDFLQHSIKLSSNLADNLNKASEQLESVKQLLVEYNNEMAQQLNEWGKKWVEPKTARPTSRKLKTY